MTKKPDPYSKAAIVAHLRWWYLQNYEDPAESTPVDSGEYVYIWGEPCSVEEALQEEFADVFAESLIEAVAKQLEDEHDIYEWVPVPQPDPEDA